MLDRCLRFYIYWLLLSAQAKTRDQILVTIVAFALEVIQQFAALIHHAQQSATRMVVVLVCLCTNLFKFFSFGYE